MRTCERCHGEGFIEYGHNNNPEPDRTERCGECDGFGIVPLAEDLIEHERERAACPKCGARVESIGNPCPARCAGAP